ncbi:transporter substrate-binding domain-containing protein [Streptomyces sp. NRRL F-5123]|uniref:transporter substrate-binding domain-containing protein n=1 Tax=Streptomyces sp. NRRL F-5123 TaxID=1463856 RepID=UPI00099D3E8E|nr:transporter substrate-binding domain-containing protein [Streptomyces sp. NRRL F-5123]
MTSARARRRPARTPLARRGPLAALAAATAALLLLAGCGSSDSGKDSDAGKDGTQAAAAKPGDSGAVPTQDVVSAITTDPTIAAELPAKIRDSGKLVLGTTKQPGTSALPHGGEVDGKSVGLDVDLRDAVAKVLGVQWDIQYGTFPTVIPGVQNGRYDVGQDNFGVTKAREQVVDFASYLNDGQAFLGSKDSDLTSVKQIADVCGLTIATGSGSTFQQILEANKDKCAAAGKKPYTVQYSSDAAATVLGLRNGRIDVMFGPTLGLKYDAAHIPGTRFLGEVSSTTVGFVTARNSPVAKALSDAVNKLIASGDYAKIFAKWGLTGSGIPQSQVNPPATF